MTTYRLIFLIISLVLTFAFGALWVIGIWTGDSRFGLSMIPVAIAAVVFWIIVGNQKFYADQSKYAYPEMEIFSTETKYLR